LLGEAAYDIVDANRTILAARIAVRILLEAAVLMSKLNPSTVDQSGVPAPSLANWSSMRALHPENTQAIITEVCAVTPVMPARLPARVRATANHGIAVLNLVGTGCEAIAAQDQAEIASLFHGNVEAVKEDGSRTLPAQSSAHPPLAVTGHDLFDYACRSARVYIWPGAEVSSLVEHFRSLRGPEGHGAKVLSALSSFARRSRIRLRNSNLLGHARCVVWNLKLTPPMIVRS
jgi:hypothetical protein